MFVRIPFLSVHCISNGILNETDNWFSSQQEFFCCWLICLFFFSALCAHCQYIIRFFSEGFLARIFLYFRNNSVITIVGFVFFDVEWVDIDIIRVVGIYDARWAWVFARASPPLKLEDPSNWVGKRGWRKLFTKNGVCAVDACTELLMANSTIGKNSLQSG